METVIEIKHLEKAFNNIPILTDINLELKRGENIAILGKSGTGKSVLTKCIDLKLAVESTRWPKRPKVSGKAGF